MQNDDNSSEIVEPEVVESENTTENETPKTELPPPLETPSADVPGDSSEKQSRELEDGQQETIVEERNRVSQYAESSQVGILSAMTGSHNTANNNSYYYGIGAPNEPRQTLDGLVRVSKLESPARVYQSLKDPELSGQSGRLLVERILLVSCHDEDIALHVARSIAYELNVAKKALVTIDENGQRDYNFPNLIDALARPKERRKASSPALATVFVWDAGGKSGETSGAIVDSLLSASARIEQYRQWLTERGASLICIVPLQRLQEFDEAYHGRLRALKIDFLRPLLEHYEPSQYESLVCTILEQRQKGRWSENEEEFYREVSRPVRNNFLVAAIEERKNPDPPAQIGVQDLFDRQDPLIDTVLYAATYFRDLSPQDFSYLVELFLGETTEEVARYVPRRQGQNGNDVVEVVERTPLVERWRRDADSLLRRCKLVSLKNEDGKRVIDFQGDGLRRRLSQFIRNENYFFYESNFVFLRQQGLLFSPKKSIAEGARDLLVEVATQYAPDEVANWLYEIIYDFEEMSEAVDQLKSLSPRFQLLPDSEVTAARHYVAYGLSRVLLALEKEDELQEAVSLFWQKLAHNQHQWFLALLRRMGDSAPPDTLQWLKRLLDQGKEQIRKETCTYLGVYLLHKESSVYPALKELMEWSKVTQAGRIAQEMLIAYCRETNKRLAQQDYGRWPSTHPLFGFQSRAEAEEWLDQLVGWVCTAAVEVDEDNALSIVADIFAGWYLILTGTAGDPLKGEDELSLGFLRDFLFESLARHIPRAQRNKLGTVWDELRSEIVDRVVELDNFVNKLTAFTLPTVELLSDAAVVRQKLLDMRTSLNELSKLFMAWVAKTTPVKEAYE